MTAGPSACSSSSLDHFRAVGRVDGCGLFWLNSILVTLSAVLLAHVIALGAAYALEESAQADGCTRLGAFGHIPFLGTDWGATKAASTLFAAPALVVFLLRRRHVTSGFAAGAVKG
ncbi:hypothetical protein ACWGDT_05805 [Streptomyces avermitilis]